MEKRVRTRIAPSPTGDPHVGTAYIALFNLAFAHINNGDFILRIEDTDQNRYTAGSEQMIFDALKWLDLNYAEGPDVGGPYGPYRQSERFELYGEYAKQLVEKGGAYYCFCTQERLEKLRERQKAMGKAPGYDGHCRSLTQEEIQAKLDAGEPYVIRLKMPYEGETIIKDRLRGDIVFENNKIDDQVLLKADGFPTYHLANVVDDHLMEITHVLRGDDHVANTPKQLVVYEAFGWKAPEFGHMSLIINTETGKKLSKRDETVLQFIEQYRELGYLPDAMFNFITLLGWSPVGESEIFNKQEFIKMFDAKRLSKSPAAFDGKKLEWINNQYVKAAKEDEIMDSSLRQLIKAGKVQADPDAYTIEWARKLISLYKQQMSYTGQIVEMADVFFNEPPVLSEDAKKELADESAAIVLKEFAERVKDLPIFDAVEIQNTIRSIQKDTKIKGRKLYMPIRIATTREMHGPELAPSIELLGREKALKHLKQTLEEMN